LPPGWFVEPQRLGIQGVFAVIVLVLATQPLFELILTRPDWRIIFGMMWGPALLAGLWLAWRAARLRWLTWSMRRLPFLWFVMLASAASCLWSLDPAWSLYKISWPLATTLVCISLGYLMRPNLLMAVLAWALAAVLLASLAVELVSVVGIDGWRGPAAGFPVAGQRWRGTTPHPNGLGEVAATGAVFFLVALLYGRLQSALAVAMFAVAVLITLMSRSATSIIMLVTGSLVVMCFRWGKRLRLGGDLASVLITIGLMAGAALALVYWDQTTAVLGKDVTVTGRTEVWTDALAIIERRPALGFGYGAVWGLWDLSFFPELETTRQWSHAHNGYLQLGTEVGLPAVGAALLLLVHALIRGIRAFSRWSSASALFSTSFVVMFLVGNLTEVRLFVLGTISWLILVILATALARAEDPATLP
jgi:exopolysaccharide production protein ExoQ